MGKSNRIKASKANKKAVSLGDYGKKKSSMPNWAVNLIAITLTLAILLGGAFLALGANGTIMRMRTAVRSENFRVDGKMMTYFINAKYQNFLSTYSAYLSNLSLDNTKPLQDQTFGDTSANASALDKALLGEFEGTWFDYFASETEKEVKNMLIYCEEAYKLGLKLGDAEKKNIDDAIATIEETATSYGYPLNAYLAASYGEGVKEKDLRHAMELSELATLGMNAMSDKLNDAIGNDRVLSTYEADSAKYNLIDYTFYSFRVDYAEISEDMKKANANATDEEILAEYKKQIAEAKQKANLLLATGSIEEFEKAVLSEIAAENYDVELDGKSLPTENKPSEDDLTKIRNGMIAQIVKEIMDDAEAADAFQAEGDKYVGYEVETTKAFADIFNEIKGEVYDMVEISRPSYVKDKAAYVDSDSFSTWAFDAARKVDDTHRILNGDGADESAEITREDGYFRADVYRMRATQYKDTSKTKDLAYMAFSTESEAQAAIDALKAAGTLDQATFDRIAAEKASSSHDVLENYVKGDMGSTTFDDWVFADGRTVGDYTDKPVKLGESSFVVLYYVAEGDEAWFATVKTALFNEDFEAYFENAQNTTPIEVKVNVIKKIKIGAN